jgi:hypothetical protein
VTESAHRVPLAAIRASNVVAVFSDDAPARRSSTRIVSLAQSQSSGTRTSSFVRAARVECPWSPSSRAVRYLALARGRLIE